MIKSNDELFKEFFENVKEDYPKLSYDKIKTIVTSPWIHLKDTMENELDDMRIQFFGKFLIFPKRVIMEYKKLKERFDKGLITEKTYKEKKEQVEKYCNEKNIKLN